MSGEAEKCPYLHIRPKFDVFILILFFSFSCSGKNPRVVTLFSQRISTTAVGLN